MRSQVRLALSETGKEPDFVAAFCARCRGVDKQELALARIVQDLAVKG